MSKFNPPKELSFEGNLSENWERWKKEFKFYLTATESDEKEDNVKISRLLTTIGEKARDIYYTFTFASEGDDMKLEPVIAKFDEYFNPRKNLPYTRFKFFTYNQVNGQTIDEYVTELKSRCRHCEFGTLKESLIRDRIVAGIQDAKVRERLLRETDLSLDKAVSMCRASEATKKQVEEMATSPIIDNVDSINNFNGESHVTHETQPLKGRGKIVLRKCLETMINQELASTVEMRIKKGGVRHMAKYAINVESGTILPQCVNQNQSAILNKNSTQVMKELSSS